MSDYIEKALQLSDLYDEMVAMQSLNDSYLRLHWGNKIVFEKDEEIYRIDNPPETHKRILLAKFFEREGYNIFLPETIKISKFPLFIVTSQRKITLWKRMDQNTIENIIVNEYKERYQTLRKLFTQLGVLWYNDKNIGEENNKIKIFDCISNTAIRYDVKNIPTLLDRDGKELITWSQ